ncbi:MAG: nicotinate-nicotinamide nucleotide adenylyltransferase, partial [Phyllobacteriaceae bacterium]|nr:nicotinate-nicotinamide nucleotide adenylyltransferase [Phyllobacteriaceae bacterium]
LGGTFNPVQIGHLRLAVETTERLGCDRLVFLPGHAPRHRDLSHLLPFDLRIALLVAATRDEGAFVVDDAERRHPDAPYSRELLPRLCRDAGIDDASFVLGLEQFERLPSWFRGRELPDVVDLVVCGREERGEAMFADLVARFWTDFSPIAAPSEGTIAFERSDGRRIVHLAVPRIDVSSTLVRRLWRQRRSIAHLVPDPVLELLEQNRAMVDAAWADEAERRGRGEPPVS